MLVGILKTFYDRFTTAVKVSDIITFLRNYKSLISFPLLSLDFKFCNENIQEKRLHTVAITKRVMELFVFKGGVSKIT
jgi:hypothetical protein